MLETGFQIDSLHRAQSFTTYESHVLFALRFMIDCSISGGNWVELKSGAYKLLSMDDPRKQSHCQLEVHINYADIISHPAEGQLMLPSHLWVQLRMGERTCGQHPKHGICRLHCVARCSIPAFQHEVMIKMSEAQQ